MKPFKGWLPRVWSVINAFGGRHQAGAGSRGEVRPQAQAQPSSASGGQGAAAGGRDAGGRSAVLRRGSLDHLSAGERVIAAPGPTGPCGYWPKRATSDLKRGHSCFSRQLGALPRTLTIGLLCRIADGIGNSLDISPKTSRLRRPCPLPPIRDNAPLSCVAWRRAWCASSGRENRVAQWNTL